MKTYSTSQLARLAGIHPNTVRLYEKLELITKAPRKQNGYRVFTELQLTQCTALRLAFSVEILQNGLRKKIIEVLRAFAAKDFDTALFLTGEYTAKIRLEQKNALEAVEITGQILSGTLPSGTAAAENRIQAAKELGITADTLRNWERNGLLYPTGRQKGRRSYGQGDMQKLKIIRALRCANYSLQSILRLMSSLSKNTGADVAKTLNTPSANEDIISACDRLLVSLDAALKNALKIQEILRDGKEKFSTEQ